MHNSQPHQIQIAPSGSHATAAMQTPILLKIGRAGRPASTMAVLLKVITPALLTACLWSKVWLGGTVAALLCLAAVILLVSRPRILPLAGLRIAWAQQVGFGEKIWLNRLLVPVPQGLNYRLTTLYMVFWAGVLVALSGAFLTLPLLSATGLAVAYSAQWSCFGKMIHLYRIMKDKYPLYRFWAATPGNDNGRILPGRSGIAKRSA